MTPLNEISGPAVPDAAVANFWNWFTANAQRLYQGVSRDADAEACLQEIIDRLQEVNDGFYALTGLSAAAEAELVVTVDGVVKHIVFAEALVAQAPVLPNWKFTALKPALGFADMQIEMDGLDFSSEKIFFFTQENRSQPDQIDILLVYTDYSADRHDEIENGLLIFLENALGELNFVTQIDRTSLVPDAGGADLIPVDKISDYLVWRGKEFVEKYDGTRYDTGNDSWSVMQAEDENDRPLIAVINRPLLDWDAKASHPWMAVLEFEFTGGESGMPLEDDYALMDEAEAAVIAALPDADGHLNIGRETHNNSRTVFIACKDFRQSSQTISRALQPYKNRLQVNYQIFKDKYWEVVERFEG